MDARLILDPAAPGGWNMAVDEALLESAGESGGVTLRFYAWSEPTVSIGYFQRYEERQEHAPSSGLPLVRGATGGGAIVHDRELTYSFCAPTAAKFARNARSVYDIVHGALIDALGELGIAATLCDHRATSPAPPFLCFERREPGDVLVQGWKIGGSAQRRHKNAILQQGSILLETSAAAPTLPGLFEIAHQRLGAGELAGRLSTRLGELLELAISKGGLSPAELEGAQFRRQTRFASPAWTHRK